MLSSVLLYSIAAIIGYLAKIDIIDIDAISSISPQDVWQAAGLGVLTAGCGAAFDRLPFRWSQQILSETKGFVLHVLGRGQSPVWQVALVTLVLSLFAAIGEETLFRGLLLPLFSSLSLSPFLSLSLSSLAFGLAHFPVFGASSLVETALGTVFGLSFLLSGNNLLVPVIVHAVYDFISIMSIWVVARDELRDVESRLLAQSPSVSLKPLLAPGSEERERKTEREREGGRSREEEVYEAAAREAFELMDANGDGRLDKVELALCMSVFIRYVGRAQVKQQVEEMFADTDKDKDGFIDWPEFLESAREARDKRGNMRPPLGWPVLHA
eukprot:CAMPEP_0182418164 /NCGR_PEP_ID=MMETSP1167-20130531/2631_1 /TAXON_ID=2988 /ORGANISM="Mallomonas Sp, Strain CCMP3275" /LENGTH=325 /DNA_ID=CAMNT_0024592207 /DNA_START=318 /DNA_END=1295 /DNA_ORIENTATION=+